MAENLHVTSNVPSVSLAALPVWSQLTANSVHTCMISHFSNVRLFVTLWIVAHQAPLSMGFFSKNTGVDCHTLLQGILSTQGWNLHLLHLLHWQVGSLPLAPPGKPRVYSSVQFSSFQSLSRVHSLRLHGLQHSRLPCRSQTPGAYLNSCPSSQ